MNWRGVLLSALFGGAMFAPIQISQIPAGQAAEPAQEAIADAIVPVHRSDADWKKLLTAKQFDVTRRKATETAYSGRYWNNHRPGIYRCICCELDLFTSDAKYESQTGWPSFWQTLAARHLTFAADFSDPDEARTEVACARCEAHLGHVFRDGPPPSGLRFCINSTALNFVDAAKPAPATSRSVRKNGR